jgi:hypothetical protein
MSGPTEQEMATMPAARAVYEAQLQTAADALLAAIRGGVTDGAETISHVLATVAANLGGLHMLTAARPSSWEADHVDRFLASTVGVDGEWLLQYRTAPIEVVECLEDAMGELGIQWLYDDSYALVDAAEDATGAADEHAADEDTADEAYERIARAEELIDDLKDRDYAAYRVAFEAQVQAAADELRRTRYLPATVTVRVRWVEWADRDQATDAQDAWGTVESELWEAARQQTPPPGFTEPLADIPGPRTPGEVLRDTGRMPHQRIRELAHYAAPAQHPQPLRPDGDTDDGAADGADGGGAR